MIDSDVVQLIAKRFAIGKKKYGHGVPVYTAFEKGSKWGCRNWMDMALEEFLDGIIYVAADYLKHHVKPTQERDDYNDLILVNIKNWKYIQSEKHRLMIEHLLNCIALSS